MCKETRNIKQHLRQPVCLVGMMASGKSHTGRQLAHALDLEFYDTDRIIEEKAGRSVAEIFSAFGEKKFREAEKNTITELLDGQVCVIATGGGMIMNKGVLPLLKEKAITIWLKADAQTILNRAKGNNKRPLLQSENPQAVIDTLIEKRNPFYAQADIVVETSQTGDGQSLQKVIKALCAFLKTDSF